MLPGITVTVCGFGVDGTQFACSTSVTVYVPLSSVTHPATVPPVPVVTEPTTLEPCEIVNVQPCRFGSFGSCTPFWLKS